MADPVQRCVALYTFGLLKAPLGSEELREFAFMSPSVFGEAEASKGFIANAAVARPDLKGRAGLGADYGPWGVGVALRFYRGGTGPGEVAMMHTLSLWQDVEAAKRFVYNGLHRTALKRRYDWFVKGAFPGYVLCGSLPADFPPGEKAQEIWKRWLITAVRLLPSPSPILSLIRARLVH